MLPDSLLPPAGGAEARAGGAPVVVGRPEEAGAPAHSQQSQLVSSWYGRAGGSGLGTSLLPLA